MRSFQSFVVVLVFFVSACDCYIQLSPCLTGWPVQLEFVGRFGLIAGSIIVGAFIAHALMSVLQDVSILDGLVQEEPVEQEVYQ